MVKQAFTAAEFVQARRRFLRHCVLGAGGLLLAGCTAPLTSAASGQELAALVAAASRRGRKPPMPSETIRPALVKPDVALEVKIGQMLMLGFRGTTAQQDPAIVRALTEQHVGGVVLFDVDVGGRRPRNIASPQQVAALTAELQALATLPLIISVDQEGGNVARLNEKYGFPATLSAAALGERNDPEFTQAEAGKMAQTLAEAGVTLNLAPVVDVRLNPDSPIIARPGRSFSADPAVVAAQAEAFIDGHHAHGVRCTLKHFPGHGSALGDTHLGFTDVTETWREDELLPYRALIAKGKVDAIMTAHVFNARLDPELPATLSPAIVTGLLRQTLGYEGVVISDDMQMRAVADHYSLEKAFELAILAGVDIIAVANNMTYAGAVADRFATTVMRLLDEEVIDEARIEQSYRRILKLKGLA
ncbi:glycoside hydrolase family 3 protein [Caldilinea sp.]|uniref:glycoside hydrolase family 3 protein n=1 Tax=Caldilinea sp. TaxID=2293560 RepID=UPI0021DD8794|nr:glycoside hydrolase family 3 protein [Caldilinea sp.]GIV69664.1 MAG: glycosyl hydrolase [Caldilinea sp.]